MSPPDSPSVKSIPGGVTAPSGFLAAGVRAGIKREKSDLALLFSEREAAVAGVFTLNAMAAPPVLLCRERIRAGGRARAVIINSGNANACTGERGAEDARAMCRRTAEALGFEGDEEVLVASTGIIGRRLPMLKIHNAIPAAVAALDPRGGDAAAEAILTTDACPKTASVEVSLSRGTVRVGGMGKGAGMIRPRLGNPQGLPLHATMLVFLTTDAAVEATALQRLLEQSADVTFNCITVDGETSTNDTVLLLANGASGIAASGDGDREALRAGIEAVCAEIAQAIVRDGEGATKFVTVIVEGAADDAEARRAAFAIGDSVLVKTALFGNDPNWGRIVSAAGACGVRIDPSQVRVCINGIEAFGGGTANAEGEEAFSGSLKRSPDVTIRLALGVGSGSARVWASDLSYEYVRINAEYHT